MKIIHGLFENSHKAIQALVILLVVLLCAICFACISMLVPYWLGINANLLTESRRGMLVVELIQSAGTFIVGSIICAFLLTKQSAQMLRINSNPQARIWCLAVVAALLIEPTVGLIAEWNTQLQLPAFLANLEQLMKSMEDQAAALTQLLLPTQSAKSLIPSLLVVALVPAIGEEWLFRGVLQSYFMGLCRHKHLAIWLCATVFSFIHFQFYGFFARLLLGAVFGYIVLLTGSIWPAVLTHFINNGTAVLGTWLEKNQQIPAGYVEHTPIDAATLVISALTALLSIAAFYKLYRIYKSSAKASSSALETEAPKA